MTPEEARRTVEECISALTAERASLVDGLTLASDVAELIVQDLHAIIEDEAVRLVTDSQHASWEAWRKPGAAS